MRCKSLKRSSTFRTVFLLIDVFVTMSLTDKAVLVDCKSFNTMIWFSESSSSIFFRSKMALASLVCSIRASRKKVIQGVMFLFFWLFLSAM